MNFTEKQIKTILTALKFYANRWNSYARACNDNAGEEFMYTLDKSDIDEIKEMRTKLKKELIKYENTLY